uniref:nuclear pore complex protein NUP1 isoform X2 n=1 Tax=Erigeron canadensis TaxID=72917 RepID=UPI001CB993C1|nr:nuclear pore complex protein NUP1 isoform X2 [Erigeron canadensis]
MKNKIKKQTTKQGQSEREMENAKPSSSAPPYSTGAGAGGKERKPFNSRKRQSTPYDRPPRASPNNNSSNNNDNNNNNNKSNELKHDEDGGGWLSKLVVNPARRLIVSGASRILPSFFSSSDSYCENDSYSDHGDDAQDIDTNVTENTNTDGAAKHISEIGVSTCSGDAGPSNQMENLNRSLQHNDVQQDKSENTIGDLGVDQIENLLKGKQFSRDESKRLMEILNSRLVDSSSNAEREKKSSSTVLQGQARVDVLDPAVPSRSTMGHQYDAERTVFETPMPRLQSNMQDEIAASPIDIARAYMGSRTSELGYNTYTNISADGREQQHNDLPPLRPHFLNPSSKSSTCWPGAMVQDQRGYMTPQSQRGRYGVHSFARTPYSRPKPKLNQLQGDSRLSTISLAPFQLSRTPNSSKVKTSSNVMDGGYGSVGPIRRVRNKYTSAQNTSSSSVSRSFMPVFERNSATAGTSGTSTISTTTKLEQTLGGVKSSSGPSNETVRKILEQLDRHIPTPKEKEAELKLATGWKKSSSQDTDLIFKGSSFLATGSDLQKFSAMSIPQVINKDPVINLNAATNTLSSVDEAGVPSFSIKNMGAANERSTFAKSKGKEIGQPWSTDNQINSQDVPRKRTFQPISPKRPDPWQVMASENGRGFTFPFAVNTSSASEPPTPSIMPSFPVTAVPQSKELPAIPLYSFGAKKSSQRVVFSFPSTSSVPVDDGDSDHMFNFGSDKKRVSFASIGNDAIVTN